MAKRGKSVRRLPAARKTPKRRKRAPAGVDLKKQIATLKRALAEALERQTAVSEVLQVISSTPGDLEPVFKSMLENATRICGADFGQMNLYEEGSYRPVALYNVPAAYAASLPHTPFRPHPQSGLGTVARTRQVVHIEDIRTLPPYLEGNPSVVALADLAGARSYFVVPMLKENELIGAITIYRQEVKPFTARQTELVANFAKQAVIAIENTRLLGELRESLQQQTATADVLKAISRSAFDLQTILDTLVESAARLCEAEMAFIHRREGEQYRAAATFGFAPEFWAFMQSHPITPGRGSIAGRVALERHVIQIEDVAVDPEYTLIQATSLARQHTTLGVPLLREKELIGVIVLARQRVEIFTEKQIALVATFADQAVIAIENARLFDEVQARTRDLSESLQQQTATADVLKVISRSTFDIQAVLKTLVESAARLCQAENVQIFLRDGEVYRLAAHNGFSPEYQMYVEQHPISAGRGTLVARTALEAALVHIDDVLLDPEYTWHEGQKLAGFRAMLGVPLLREGSCVGVMAMTRMTPRPFTTRQTELVTSFADQAVIAIENVRLFDEVQARTEDLRESLQQQTATADVLKVISSSPGELEPVFQAMLENATRICEANFSNLFLREGDAFRAVAVHGDPAYVESWQREPLITLRDHPGVPLDRLARTNEILHIHDLTAEPPYIEGDRRMIALVDSAGARTMLLVPMLRENALIGAIVIYRQEVRAFSDKQIELVKNFASQAVIAFENARLLNELRESLQQQTATADVLKVISRSTFDLQTVLQTLVESAARLCEADLANIWRPEGTAFHLAASFGIPGKDKERLENVKYLESIGIEAGRGSIVGRVLLERRTIQVHDIQADAEYELSGVIRIGNYRTALGVPLLREGVPVGVIFLSRCTVRPFTDKHIELVTTFADQAVIAIENVRLFDEVQARTRDLSESLQQQTAAADVLKIISSSPGELEPVFQAMLENATRICEAKFGTLYLSEGDGFRAAAMHNAPPAYEEARARVVHPPPDTTLWRAAKTKQVVQITDAMLERGYIEGDPFVVSAVTLGGYRSILGVPMLHEDELIGVITIFRQEVRPFTDKQIELLTNFAAQAVIAIENTRLLRELRESLQQQTATADVLKVISRSTFDLPTVLQTLVESAARLCDAERATITRQKNGVFFRAENYGFSDEFKDYVKDVPIKPDRGSAIGRVLLGGEVVHIPDVDADPDYIFEGRKLGDFRSILGVPMLREGVPIGVIILGRSEARPFTDKQFELATTFADQAAIAIENVRLFDEVQAKTRDLSEALVYQTGSGNILKVIASSPTDVGPVLRAIVDSACELCDAYDAVVRLKNGDDLQLRAHHGPIPIDAANWRISRNWTAGRAVLDKKPVHVRDMQSAEGDEFPEAQKRAREQGHGTILSVPLLRKGESVGAIVLRRREVHPFTEKQIALLQTFADQAVIAIGNVQMFEQVKERTKELSLSLDELRTAQDRLIQTEKLASLGQLTAGIAHEIKNPLNFVNNFSAVSVELIDEMQETLEGMQLDKDRRTEMNQLAEALRGNLEKVVQHGKRADAIVKNMLLHSRQGSGEHRPVDVNALVEESLNLAYHGARAEKQGFNITMERSFDPNAGDMDVFPQEITRVLLNLISNGFYAATKRKGQADSDGYEPTLAAATKNLGDRVEIRIRDSGTGIPPEVKEKMFNPFFTTKPAGEGTGLGLSLSYDIVVKQHGGSIEVDTQPGEFTEFRVILPRKAADSKAGANS